MKMGYNYLTPTQALDARGGRTSNVLLENILKKQIKKINSITYKDKEYKFSEANINTAIHALRDLPVHEGFFSSIQTLYDMIAIGKSLEQNIMHDKKKSFNILDEEVERKTIVLLT